ncbi:MAG TPA: phosphotransferase, partial [Candidatus Binatia bacterium]|nr:phosphotransferase [Candidatus Binatia bacterium]
AVHRTPVDGDLQALLPDRGPDHYMQRLRSTRTALVERVGNRALSADETALLRAVAALCDVIEAHWGELERFCEGLPRTLVHGDFVIKNLRIQPTTPGPDLLVFDWEMAGWGLPASDLAQFVGNTVTPDLEVYCSVLRQDSPHLDVHEIQRLADYGTLLRVVDKIYWETITMVGDSYEFLVYPLSSVKKYEPQLGAGLRALDWSRHD